MQKSLKRLRPLTEQERNLIIELVKQGMTYHQILDEVRKRLGSKIETCHIAEVKRLSGIGTRGAWNSGKRYRLGLRHRA